MSEDGCVEVNNTELWRSWDSLKLFLHVVSNEEKMLETKNIYWPINGQALWCCGVVCTVNSSWRIRQLIWPIVHSCLALKFNLSDFSARPYLVFAAGLWSVHNMSRAYEAPYPDILEKMFIIVKHENVMLVNLGHVRSKIVSLVWSLALLIFYCNLYGGSMFFKSIYFKRGTCSTVWRYGQVICLVCYIVGV